MNEAASVHPSVLDHQTVEVASYPAFLRLHTVSDKNLKRGKAGYEATVEDVQ